MGWRGEERTKIFATNKKTNSTRDFRFVLLYFLLFFFYFVLSLFFTFSSCTCWDFFRFVGFFKGISYIENVNFFDEKPNTRNIFVAIDIRDKQLILILGFCKFSFFVLPNQIHPCQKSEKSVAPPSLTFFLLSISTTKTEGGHSYDSMRITPRMFYCWEERRRRVFYFCLITIYFNILFRIVTLLLFDLFNRIFVFYV